MAVFVFVILFLKSWPFIQARSPRAQAAVIENSGCHVIKKNWSKNIHLYIQWNLRTRRTLGLIDLSLVETLSLSRRYIKQYT